MFKLKSFIVNVLVGMDTSATNVGNRVKLINSFTGEIFWEDKDKVRNKYLLSAFTDNSNDANCCSVTDANARSPQAAYHTVIYTYSDFEFKLRTLFLNHNIGIDNSTLFDCDIWKYPISKFFVYEFAAQLGVTKCFDEIGKYDILEYEDWTEIFTPVDCKSKKYNVNTTDIRGVFMKHNRLAPKIWKYLYKNNINVSYLDNCGRACEVYLNEYIQNPYLDCDDIITNYFNSDRRFSINWQLLVKNASIGKEFFIKYEHEFRIADAIRLDKFEYWAHMIQSPNIDTNKFVDYVETITDPHTISDMWYDALCCVDLTNNRVIAYIEANPLILTTIHSDNPTMTNRWIKHIIHNAITQDDETWEDLQPHDCMLEEDLLHILNTLDTDDKYGDCFDYANAITNPNLSDKFIEEQIFGRLNKLDELHILYAHPRVGKYLIEKYILTPERIKLLGGLIPLSQNPNLNESNLQIICDRLKMDKVNNKSGYPKKLDWATLIANPNISIEFLINHVDYIRENCSKYYTFTIPLNPWQ